MQVYNVKSISELHQLRGLPLTGHPLISVVQFETITDVPAFEPKVLVPDFYMIALKQNFAKGVKVKYGQQEYDFDAGVLSFMAPGQLFGMEIDRQTLINAKGWMMMVHPDFLWNTPLAKKMRQYAFFDYAVNEALFLSDKEENTLMQLVNNIEQEIHANIDSFSHNIIISLLESLLNYSERFYQRQFLTRRKSSHQLLEQLDTLLEEHFKSVAGLPTVSSIATQLHVSADYLSGMLKALTGLNTQQLIHEKLIEKAKLQLSTTSLSVSEIAYQLGFEHPQSFSKLFKTKTNLSPLAFRQSFHKLF
ncbi:helix-turn-helix domain-containing protein [Chitinophaga sancti]|uniref:AraC-type DNA-binding protein n=1 Tax=Chitinophaga sancti TaxID=1004 RepID=A0A1K1R727_9BACT|nr:helix-turn-helix transcriptional regulator [Chitinophaga sancti]WQD64173.1 helix-turn-helix transcriptional regulator [Chitinophaga sancti]WQG90203.1 helix-turn-helix transcriptional regulator [Chitinophaga sancti]SFW67745.1 AraC-type DNA-binding protein [Chitinophaga sancti]